MAIVGVKGLKLVGETDFGRDVSALAMLVSSLFIVCFATCDNSSSIASLRGCHYSHL